MPIQGKEIKFLLDSSASVSWLSMHHVDVSKVNLAKEKTTLHMWNGYTETSLGTTCMKVFNPKTGQSLAVYVEIVPQKLKPVLGCTAAQQLIVITMETGNYERIAKIGQGVPEDKSEASWTI